MSIIFPPLAGVQRQSVLRPELCGVIRSAAKNPGIVIPALQTSIMMRLSRLTKEGRFAIVTMRGAGCGGRCLRETNVRDADGPSRDIPAHRLAPWGSAKAFSSYRGRAAACQSPPAVMDRRAGHRGFSRSKPLKPLRAERRMLRRDRGDYARALVSQCA